MDGWWKNFINPVETYISKEKKKKIIHKNVFIGMVEQKIKFGFKKFDVGSWCWEKSKDHSLISVFRMVSGGVSVK